MPHTAALLPLTALFLLGFAVAQAAETIPSRYQHDTWTSDDGLPENSINAIVQTRDGYLWLGTYGGLVRFDGVQFTVFDKSNTPAIRQNTVYSLLEDRHGDLWIGTNGGGLIRFRNGIFTAFPAAPDGRSGLRNGVVRALHEDSAGRLWVGTDEGLHERQGEAFRAYTTQDGLPHNAVWALEEDRRGGLWIGTFGGLCRFTEGRFFHDGSREGVGNRVVRAIHQDREDRLWIGTSAGLYRKDGEAFSRYSTREGLSNDIVVSLAEDRDGTLWIGTNGGGVTLMKDETFVPLEGRLSDSVVQYIYEDREGSLWLGTLFRGLHRLRLSGLAALTTNEGLANDVIRGLHEGHDGSLWIGTNGGGLCRLLKGRITSIGRKEGLSSDIVIAVHEDRLGTVWAGTYLAGLNAIRNGRVERVLTTKDGLAGDHVTAVHEDRRGTLWVGTYGGGLTLLKDGGVSRFTTKDGLSNDVIRTLYEDRRGDMWVGTNDGLNHLRDGAVSRYGAKEGLTSAVVSLHEDQAGTLWIGTRGAGLHRLKGGTVKGCTSQNGLFNDVVFSILEDDLGWLWMSCDKGVFRVRKADLEAFMDGRRGSIESVSYSREDGMPSSECSGGFGGAGWKARDGRLYFPTIRGLVVVDPPKIRTSTMPPPVMIERFLAREAPVSLQASHIVIPPGDGKLQFHYTALSFLAPRKIRFKYRLSGFDKEWVDAGAMRTAYYTNIPPGRYRFQVLACNSDGVWNEQGSFVEFTLAPHFYQTLWFYALCGLGAGAVVLGAHRFRIRQLKSRERQLARRVDEALTQVKTLSGLLPICAHCKSIRDDKGYWSRIETYLGAHSQAEFSHGLCPKCMKELYPDYADAALRRTE